MQQRAKKRKFHNIKRLVYYQVNLEKGTQKCTLPVAYGPYSSLKHHSGISGDQGTGLAYSKEKVTKQKMITF